METRSDRTSLAERGYRVLVRLYPGPLRRAYREQMISVFQDMERDAGARGRFARWSFIVRAYVDVVWTQRRARRYERERLARTLLGKRSSFMSTWKHDAVVALRFLRKQPGFTLVAAITLALGIGANTAIFSVLYGVLLRPLGLDNPDALAVVRLHRVSDARDVSGFHPTYLDDLRLGIEASGSSAELTSYIYESVTLVIAQVTLSVVLLVCAALMVRSLLLLHRVPLGFGVEGLAGARIYLDDDAYADDAHRALYFENLLERLRERVDIDAAGAGSALPMDPITIDYDLPYTLPGEERSGGNVTQAFFRTITPGFLETLRIPLKAGRTFDARDRAATRKVAVINETFARVAWPDRSPVGERFSIYSGREELHVVGVVGDVHFAGPSADYKPEFYVVHSQFPYGALTAVTRSRDADVGARAIADEAVALNSHQPVSGTFTMEALVAGAVSTDRFLTWLLVCFATVALLISAAGIYGVISYWVNQSRRELGVRMALGAGVDNIVGLVLARGLGSSLAGALLGLLASFVATRLLARFLYGVGPTDGLAIGTVIVLMGATATLASFVPAWRAAHVDPMSSLRVE